MEINGPFVLFLVIAVVSTYFAVSLKNWIAKLILFVIALGSSSITAGVVNLGVEWVLLFETFLFLATGITSVRIKRAGNRVLGILLIILGIVLIFLTLDTFGTAPDTIWGGLRQSFQQGWPVFGDIIQKAFGST